MKGDVYRGMDSHKRRLSPGIMDVVKQITGLFSCEERLMTGVTAGGRHLLSFLPFKDITFLVIAWIFICVSRTKKES